MVNVNIGTGGRFSRGFDKRRGRSTRIPDEVSSRIIKVAVTPTEYEDLKQVMRDNHVTMSEVIREAVNEYVADYRDKYAFSRVKPGKCGNSPRRKKGDRPLLKESENVMRMKALNLIVLVLLVLCGWQQAEAQTNPCRSPGASIILKPSLRFVGEFDDHNATIPGQPAQFVTTKYRLKVYDATVGNPSSGPFLINVDVPRAQMTAWPDTSPVCYVSPSIAIPSTVKQWAALRASVAPVSGEGAGENEATGAQAPDPFAWGQLRSSAVRVLAVP